MGMPFLEFKRKKDSLRYKKYCKKGVEYKIILSVIDSRNVRKFHNNERHTLRKELVVPRLRTMVNAATMHSNALFSNYIVKRVIWQRHKDPV